METRASHLVIGSFVLVFVAALFGFVIWLAKVEIDREFNYYYVYFDEAVSGLSVGGDVRYNGIPVGTVTAIEIDPDDPGRVRVTAELSSQVKVRTDTVARLELQGITGVSYVQLTGGSPGADILKASEKGGIPVIPSERSAIQELFAGAPELIDRVIILVNEFTKMVGPENREALSGILTNLDELMGRLGRRAPEIEQLVVDMQKTTEELRKAAVELSAMMDRAGTVVDSADATLAVARGTLTTADQVIDKDARQTLRSIQDASDRFASVAGRLEALMARNEESLDAFAGDGLVEFTRFIEEARQLVATSSRLIEDIESDPRQFLLGGEKGGVELERRQ